MCVRKKLILTGLLLGLVCTYSILSSSKVLESSSLISKRHGQIVTDAESEGQHYGPCYNFNTPNTLLDEFNEKINPTFKLSIETESHDTVAPNFINRGALIDIYHQIYVANEIFSHILDLYEPLSTNRYRKANFINIVIEDSDKKFGAAFDEVRTNNNLGQSNCFIAMKMSSQKRADNSLTPSHELFHLYYNSMSMFKQRWVTEGLARWSESLIKEGTGKEEALPENKEELLEIMSSSYDASQFWTRLFRLVDQNDELSVPNYLDTVKYLNNEPILKDNKAYGVTFIKVLFDELSKESDYVSEIKGWDRYAWKEKDQKDSALNPYIWNAVKRAVAKSIPYEQQSEELRRCMEIEL